MENNNNLTANYNDIETNEDTLSIYENDEEDILKTFCSNFNEIFRYETLRNKFNSLNQWMKRTLEVKNLVKSINVSDKMELEKGFLGLVKHLIERENPSSLDINLIADFHAKYHVATEILYVNSEKKFMTTYQMSLIDFMIKGDLLSPIIVYDINKKLLCVCLSKDIEYNVNGYFQSFIDNLDELKFMEWSKNKQMILNYEPFKKLVVMREKEAFSANSFSEARYLFFRNEEGKIRSCLYINNKIFVGKYHNKRKTARNSVNGCYECFIYDEMEEKGIKTINSYFKDTELFKEKFDMIKNFMIVNKIQGELKEFIKVFTHQSCKNNSRVECLIGHLMTEDYTHLALLGDKLIGMICVRKAIDKGMRGSKEITNYVKENSNNTLMSEVCEKHGLDKMILTEVLNISEHMKADVLEAFMCYLYYEDQEEFMSYLWF